MRLISFLKLFFSIILLWFLYQKIPLDAMQTLLAQADIHWLIPVAILLTFNIVISAVKWKLFLSVDDIDISLQTLTATYMIGSFYNMFLPSNIGGDSYRIVNTIQRGNDAAKIAISVFADRLSGLLAMVFLGTVSALFSTFLLPGISQTPYFSLLPLGLFLLLSLGTILLFEQKILKRIVSISHLDRVAIIKKTIDKLFTSVSAYKARPEILVKAMCISFLFQLSFCTIVYLLAQTIHTETNYLYFCMFVPLISLIEILPFSINGIGLRDAGYVFFFGSVGMNELQTRSLALLFFATILFVSLCGGIVYLWRIIVAAKK